MAVSRRNSSLVAAGILTSRLSGFVRQRAFTHFFGLSGVADAFAAAYRIPNLMQNLLGEGVLSASFIPVYARLLEEDREEDAGKVAGAVFGLVAVLAGAITLIAVLLADPLTSLLAPGFTGERRDLTVSLVRILTPGIGLLVLSAWCLGVLNSHRRFFLSYVAPVIWNLTQVVVVVIVGIVLLADPLDPGSAPLETLETLARAFAIGTLLGGLLQFLVQVPAVRRLDPHIRPSLRRDLPGVRQVIDAFAPAVAGRGVVQLSAWLDLILASLLAAGAVGALFTAQQLYMLPISLFAMSVAAAELPELSRKQAPGPETFQRLDDGLTRMAFWVAASAVVFIVAGDLVAGALFTTGQFGRPEEILVWVLMGGFSLGLIATSSSRLLQSALYAVGDTRTPARIAAQRVAISTVVGVLLMFPLDRIGIIDGRLAPTGDPIALWPLSGEARSAGDILRIGALGLLIGGAIGAWYEYRRLAAAVSAQVGQPIQAAGSQRGRLVLPVVAAAIVGLLLRPVVGDWPRLLGGPVAAGAMGLAYVLVAARTRVEEVHAVTAAVRRISRVDDVLAIRRGQRRRRDDTPEEDDGDQR
jgi:putative peptidoglycan lipid II flippase